MQEQKLAKTGLCSTPECPVLARFGIGPPILHVSGLWGFGAPVAITPGRSAVERWSGVSLSSARCVRTPLAGWANPVDWPSIMSASIRVVDDEPDVVELFGSSFVGTPARAYMSCTTSPQRRRRWISSG